MAKEGPKKRVEDNKRKLQSYMQAALVSAVRSDSVMGLQFLFALHFTAVHGTVLHAHPG
jgi:hypothetical protein